MRPLFGQVLVTAIAAVSPPTVMAAEAGGPLLPNLRAEVPYGLKLDQNQRRLLLGFGATAYNAGPGALVIEGRRDGARMGADQLIQHHGSGYPTERLHDVGTLRFERAAGHAHWHLDDFAEYRLTPVSRRLERSAHKVGFCLGDRRTAATPLGVAASSLPVFTGSCGKDQPELSTPVQGLSPLFADPYPAFLEGQSIDVTGLPSGRYVLTHRVNPARRVRESAYRDNASSLLLRLQKRRRAGVQVLRTCWGRSWCHSRSSRMSVSVAPTGVLRGRMRVRGRVRNYRLYVPSRIARARSAPVVVVLHGGGDRESGRTIAEATGFDDVAESRGFVAVYPDARGGRFNAGDCCSRSTSLSEELAFIDRLLARVRSYLPVDARRVSATGFSNGGFMAYALACRRAAVFAAVAVVGATEATRPCRPRRPVSVLHIHARDDETTRRYDRGRQGRWPGPVELVERWCIRNRCRIRRDTAGLGFTVTLGTRCAEGADVRLILLDSGGHGWPGAAEPYATHGQPPFGATQLVGDFVSTRRRR